MKKVFLCVLVMTLMLGLAACARPVAGEVIQSDKPRGTSLDIDDTDLTMLVNGNSNFAFDLYQALNKEDGNIFYSPYSISLALATNLEPGGTFPRDDFMVKLFNFVQHAVYRGKLDMIEKLIEQPDKERVIIELGNGIEAFNSVPTAMYSFYLSLIPLPGQFFRLLAWVGTPILSELWLALSPGHIWALNQYPLGGKTNLRTDST